LSATAPPVDVAVDDPAVTVVHDALSAAKQRTTLSVHQATAIVTALRDAGMLPAPDGAA